MSKETLPAVHGERLPDFPEEKLDRYQRIAEDNVKLATIGDPKSGGGFIIKDAWHRELLGVIYKSEEFLGKWNGKELDRIPYVENELDWPEGYEPRAEILVWLQDRTKVKIRLSKTSFLYEFCEYTTKLKKAGLKPNEVLTRIATREAEGAFGKYVVVVFLLEPKHKGQSEVIDIKPEQNSYLEDSSEDIPF
jgi:hypothetical protein